MKMRDLSHLRELDESPKDWERYQKYTLDELLRERDNRNNIVLHAMLVSIQSARGDSAREDQSEGGGGYAEGHILMFEANGGR